MNLYFLFLRDEHREVGGSVEDVIDPQPIKDEFSAEVEIIKSSQNCIKT